MFADPLSPEKTAFRTIKYYLSTDYPLLSFEHTENKILDVLDEFKIWFRFNNDFNDIDVMRNREDHWNTVLNYFRAHRYDDAMAEASDIVGA